MSIKPYMATFRVRMGYSMKSFYNWKDQTIFVGDDMRVMKSVSGNKTRTWV
jgi:hypothetical protein